MNLGKKFRELISRPTYTFGFGVGNANEAGVAEQAGIECIYNGGYTEAMYAGVTDTGRRNMVEVRDTSWKIVEKVNIPVIADIDEGYGNAINAIRTASEFLGKEFLDLSSGPNGEWRVKRLAGFHIEDQRFPKRCGHISGKETVPREEFIGKIRAVAKVRDALDKNAVIIARTDAYNSKVKGSLLEAADRIIAAAKAGADLGWAEANDTKRETIVSLAGLVHSILPNYPLAFNYSPSLKWTDDPNPITFEELNKLGYKFIFITIAAGHAASFGVYEYAADIKKRGAQVLWNMQRLKIDHPTESHHKMAGVPLIQEFEREFIPGAENRQKSGEGEGSEAKH